MTVIQIARKLFCQIFKAHVAFYWLWISSAPAEAQNTDREISHLINRGQLVAAQELLESSNPNEIDRLFFTGRVHKVLQRYPQAIAIFREILRRTPSHLNAKRELAHTLLLVGEYREASSYFRALSRTDRNADMVRGYGRFLRAIEQNKPSGINLQFAVLPSTNINKGTNNTVFDSAIGEFVIDPSMQGDSGIGVQFGVSGFFRKSTSVRDQVQLNWGLSGTTYNIEGFDSATVQLSLAFRRKAQNRQWSLEPYLHYTWQPDGDDSTAVGIKYALQQNLSENSIVAVSLGRELRDYPAQEYQSGPFTQAALSLTHIISSSLQLSAGIKLEVSTPQAEHLQFTSQTLFAGIEKSWDDGARITLGFQFGDRDFVGDYPLTASPRLDTFTALSMSISSSRIYILGTVPKLSCTLTSNRSNVAFFEYNSTDCQIGFTQAF